MQHMVIIGNGVAGITAARHIRKMSDHRITVISAESDHFFSRTALMYIYMGHMTYEQTKPYADDFWKKNRIDLLRGFVETIDTGAKALHLRDGSSVSYDTLIVATGAKSNRFGWPGQDLDGVMGLYSLQDLEAMEQSTRGIERGVIVGGGLIGTEVAEMLHSRHIPVTMLVLEEVNWGNVLPPEEGRLVENHLRGHGIDIRLKTGLKEVLSNEKGRARGVITTNGEEIACGFVALTAGVSPNIDIVRTSAIETGRGVLVNEFFETNIPDVYAIGDCAEFRDRGTEHPKIEQLWYTGKMHGEVVARTICGHPTRYNRGVWFNSAKFFDIEYQTYGFVANAPRDGEESLYWEHPDRRRAVRLVYRRDNHTLVGVNVFGIRYRQTVCQEWIRDGWSVERVLENLGAANFDPEFFPQFERDVVENYNRLNPGKEIVLKRRRGLFQKQ